MKTLLLIAILLNGALASNLVDSISMTIGKSKEGHSSSKISLQHNFDSILYTTDSGYIDGFYELSFKFF